MTSRASGVHLRDPSQVWPPRRSKGLHREETKARDVGVAAEASPLPTVCGDLPDRLRVLLP